jgi:hypothetical protein
MKRVYCFSGWCIDQKTVGGQAKYQSGQQRLTVPQPKESHYGNGSGTIGTCTIQVRLRASTRTGTYLLSAGATKHMWSSGGGGTGTLGDVLHRESGVYNAARA